MGIADDAVQFRLGDALDQIDGKCDHLKKRRIDEKEFQDCLQKALQLVAGWKDHVSVKFSCSPLDPMMRGCAIRAGVHEAVDVLSLLIGAFVPATAKDCVDEFTSQCQNGAKDMSFLSRAIQLRSIFKRVEVEAVGLCADENLRIAFVEQGVFPESAHNEVLWKDVCALPITMQANIPIVTRVVDLVTSSMGLLQDCVVQDLRLQNLKLAANVVPGETIKVLCPKLLDQEAFAKEVAIASRIVDVTVSISEFPLVGFLAAYEALLKQSCSEKVPFHAMGLLRDIGDAGIVDVDKAEIMFVLRMYVETYKVACVIAFLHARFFDVADLCVDHAARPMLLAGIGLLESTLDNAPNASELEQFQCSVAWRFSVQDLRTWLDEATKLVLPMKYEVLYALCDDVEGLATTLKGMTPVYTSWVSDTEFLKAVAKKEIAAFTARDEHQDLTVELHRAGKRFRQLHASLKLKGDLSDTCGVSMRFCDNVLEDAKRFVAVEAYVNVLINLSGGDQWDQACALDQKPKNVPKALLDEIKVLVETKRSAKKRRKA
jgi:hypothetical protein